VLRKVDFSKEALLNLRNNNINNQWLFNKKELLLINQTNIIIDTNGDLRILLDNMNLYGDYTLQNKINGAFINYRVFCAGSKCEKGKQ
jgi:hypothetical protein